MPLLKIHGWGQWVLLTELKKSIAKKYSDVGSISELENEELESESDGFAFGFNDDSIVMIDDKEVGTVLDIIEKCKGYEKYDFIMNNLTVSAIQNVKNAWLKVETYKGTFAEVAIEEDCISNGDLTPIFYTRFIENLNLVDEHLFHLPNWNNKDVYEDNIDGKSAEFYVIHNGEISEITVD